MKRRFRLVHLDGRETYTREMWVPTPPGALTFLGSVFVLRGGVDTYQEVVHMAIENKRHFIVKRDGQAKYPPYLVGMEVGEIRTLGGDAKQPGVQMAAKRLGYLVKTSMTNKGVRVERIG